MRQLNILIWHIHGAYLTAITSTQHNWYVPTRPEGGEGYAGRGLDSTMPDYVREVPADQVQNLDLDLIICQTPKNYQVDRFDILSPEQQQLPVIYLEHNTPEPHPTNSRHPAADDPNATLVHVTYYNQLMWDNGQTPTRVVEHSVAIDPALRYEGRRDEGIIVVNELQRRGRMAGFDLYEQLRKRVPLTVAGMKAQDIGGIGEIHYRNLHKRVAEYRFLFSPMRYSSLPLAVIEAMTIGMPIIALATTELPTVIENGVHGFVSANIDELADRMQYLLDNPDEAKKLGDNARALAQRRFGLDRFVDEWNSVFLDVVNSSESINSTASSIL
ncbi:glycosyltransferase family 4 protein [Spirosoma sp. RP8]|uniref:Glycosyltransferase family 4 protein n=1 Tax=Spirosoma liriopis TaxID=2937440 RepID=A0ABT0HP26_9BACT|nr:glycosyltransferase family 4 protein [Spirosoma liriopis]MCK8493924.1 glycosyltransferase family 4 protein [Spirosoma liriopis]